MQNKIYIGNLSYSITEQGLRDVFSEFGDISDITIPQDRERGTAKGFAFITFDTHNSAKGALSLDGSSNGGRNIKVSIAQEKRTSDRAW